MAEGHFEGKLLKVGALCSVGFLVVYKPTSSKTIILGDHRVLLEVVFLSPPVFIQPENQLPTKR